MKDFQAKWVILSILSISFIYSCKKSSIPPVDIDQSYFPLITGKYIIYDVDSLGFNNFYPANDSNYSDTSRFQIKEEIDSVFIDNTGNQAYKIIRSRRPNENSSWIVTDVWSANLTDYTAEKVEENLRFIKLYFPILPGREWFGNAYIETDSVFEWMEGWIYEYTSVHEPLTLNNLSFDSTLTVTQLDDQNVIERNVFIEKYARNVGLIYKFEERLETQPSQPQDGYIITTTIREFN